MLKVHILDVKINYCFQKKLWLHFSTPISGVYYKRLVVSLPLPWSLERKAAQSAELAFIFLRP
jgi:hypothetical protein